MKIWWCQEHESSFLEPNDSICPRRGRGADWKTPCHKVSMRLIPDNEETVELITRIIFEIGHPHDKAHAILAALDGETP